MLGLHISLPCRTGKIIIATASTVLTTGYIIPIHLTDEETGTKNHVASRGHTASQWPSQGVDRAYSKQPQRCHVYLGIHGAWYAASTLRMFVD